MSNPAIVCRTPFQSILYDSSVDWFLVAFFIWILVTELDFIIVMGICFFVFWSIFFSFSFLSSAVHSLSCPRQKFLQISICVWRLHVHCLLIYFGPCPCANITVASLRIMWLSTPTTKNCDYKIDTTWNVQKEGKKPTCASKECTYVV